MSIGEKLLELRKSKQLSQEEVAEKLNVTRQTVSKWETDQSMPDFDKIVPLCKLYEISADYLLTGKKEDDAGRNDFYDYGNNYKNGTTGYIKEDSSIKRKRALSMAISIIMYFVAVGWIMVSIPVLQLDPIVATAIFILICGVATCIIIYTSMVYKRDKNKDEREEVPRLQKQINNVISMIILVIYLFVSFTTGAWHVTWLLWIVYALIEEIVKLLFMLRGNNDEG